MSLWLQGQIGWPAQCGQATAQAKRQINAAVTKGTDSLKALLGGTALASRDIRLQPIRSRGRMGNLLPRQALQARPRHPG